MFLTLTLAMIMHININIDSGINTCFIFIPALFSFLLIPVFVKSFTSKAWWNSIFIIYSNCEDVFCQLGKFLTLHRSYDLPLLYFPSSLALIFIWSNNLVFLIFPTLGRLLKISILKQKRKGKLDRKKYFWRTDKHHWLVPIKLIHPHSVTSHFVITVILCNTWRIL